MEKCWVGANVSATFGGAGPQFGAWVPGQVIPAGFNSVGLLESLARADLSARFSGAGLSGVVVVLGQAKVEIECKTGAHHASIPGQSFNRPLSHQQTLYK